MTTSTSEALSSANLARLGRLIVACNDDARAQTSAALVVGGSRGDRLNETAAQRASFAVELTAIVRSFGGTPREGPSAFERMRAAAHGINVLLIGENAGDAYGSCARIETKTEKLYERAARADMPKAIREVMARHHLEISAYGAELRVLSMGG